MSSHAPLEDAPAAPEGDAAVEPSAERGGAAPHVSIGEFALATIRRLVIALNEHEPAARQGDDIEALHQMRVATRQLRAMLSLFRPYLPGPVARLRARVRRLGRALGEVRDIDVQLADLLGAEAKWKEDERARLEPLRAALHDARNRARRRMLRWLDSPAAGRLRANLASLAATRVSNEGFRRASLAPAAIVAPKLVRARYERFRRAADRVGEHSAAAEYHAVRIQAKRTRYALQVFEELYGEPAHALGRSMSGMQDLLGEQQDAITAATRLVALADRRRKSLPRSTVFLMGRIAERAERISARARRRYAQAYRKTKGRRWRALRKEMAAREKALSADVARAPAAVPSPTPVIEGAPVPRKPRKRRGPRLVTRKPRRGPTGSA
jgi:CHAD domain-containing protein